MIHRFQIEGESMFPAFKRGDRVLARPCGAYRPGDVVVAKDPRNGRLLVKRVQEVRGQFYVVRGDNRNASSDSRIFGALASKDVVGKVIATY